MTKRGTQTLTYDASGRVATVVTGTATEQSLYTADGTLLMRWGGSDGASLFLRSTTLRTKSGKTPAAAGNSGRQNRLRRRC